MTHLNHHRDHSRALAQMESRAVEFRRRVRTGLGIGLGLGVINSAIAAFGVTASGRDPREAVGLSLGAIVAFYLVAGAVAGAAAGAASVRVTGKRSAIALGVAVAYVVWAAAMGIVDASVLAKPITYGVLLILAALFGVQGARMFSPYWK